MADKIVKDENGRHTVFTDFFVKSVMDNPVYAGKITYGRFGLEMIQGTRNEFRNIKHKKYNQFEGKHEAIISKELWQEMHAKRQATAGTPMGIMAQRTSICCPGSSGVRSAVPPCMAR